tara:strand:+ start:197 stop:1201 length:1005 start_codon:yes stop_codon:yes gene_type:complete
MKNIAVVGCGHWGKNLVRNFHELGCLHSICDPDKNIVKELSDTFNVQGLSFDEVIDETSVKGVVLAVPAPLHASLAIKAMEANKNVFVEKPIAMNLNEAKSMIVSAKDNRVELMVGHLLQYHPVFKKIKRYVIEERLGQIHYIYSNRHSLGKVRTEEDVLWSFAPHDMSMILSLINAEPIFVNTQSKSILQKNIADIATVYMNFESGIKAHVSVSWLNPFKEQKLVVIGENMSLVFDDVKPWDQKLASYKHQITLGNKTPNLIKENLDYISVPEAEPLKEECKHFINLINGNASPITNGEEGIRVLKVLTAATNSQEKNCSIYLNDDKQYRNSI